MSDNNPQVIFDRHHALRCPHCSVQSNFSAVSIPRYEFMQRFRPAKVGVVYRCDSCNAPVTLLFTTQYDFGNNRVWFSQVFEQVERATETFEYQHLPAEVSADLKEALTCFSAGCWNAFAAMCRRCVQSVAADLGAKGNDKVLAQLNDLKDTAQIDDDTFTVLKQVIIDGHDGAHPHLPKVSDQRAGVLLELVKDVLYQLYVRKGKLQEAMKLRTAATQPSK